jgi:hypothetical protein
MTSLRVSGDGSGFASCAAATAPDDIAISTISAIEEEKRFMSVTC